MKISGELALKQSLTLNHEMRLAIDMLSMTAAELDQVLDEELLKNPWIEEDEHYHPMTSFYSDTATAFDVALDTSSAATDFRDELLHQIGESSFNIVERDIAYHIVNNLDDDGLLSLHHEVYQDIVQELGVYAPWIDSVRRRIMDLEPLGCGAINSVEALEHQAKRLCLHPHHEFMKLLSEPHGKLSFTRISRLKADDAMFELKQLKARPSSGFREKNSVVDAIIPEVVVMNGKNGFMVTLLKKASERLVLKVHDGKKNQSFLKPAKKRALFMIKALRYRETTMATVSKAIVDHQEAWLLDRGPLKPLNLRTIADACGLHESSVSRLTRGKYLLCDKGIFELKYFFSGKIVLDASDSPSAQTVKNKIKSIIGKEDKTRPLSDQKIMEKLQEEGLFISRRCVSKYRESLDLDSAQKRRALTILPAPARDQRSW